MAFRLIVVLVIFSLNLFHTITAQANLDDNEAVVVILGGGPSGIHAAASLIENGIEDIIILEPTDQIRGYLATVEFDGKRFAPGSLWGYSPILDKLDALKVNYGTSDFDSYIVLNGTGDDVTADADARWEVLQTADATLAEVAEAIDAAERPDVSQKAVLARGGWIETSDIDRALEWYNYDFDEGQSTRDTSTVGPWRQSEAGLYDTDGVDSDYLIADADVTLGDLLLEDAENLLEDGHVRYGQFGVSVEHSDDGVTITTKDGTEYTAEYVIVAHTVGVLQHGGVTFEPALPPWKNMEICRWQMGTIDPIFMKFDTKFWGDEEFILHAGGKHGEFPVFMNMEAEGLYPAGTNILITFVSGNEAYEKEYKEDEEIIAKAVEILRKMYGDDVPEPTEFYMSRFATDPYQYGTFATWPVGDLPADGMERLEGAVGRLYFAMEDAHDEYIGIPFGSVQTGKRAAGKISECVDDDSKCESYEPEEDIYPPSQRPKSNKMRKNFNAVP